MVTYLVACSCHSALILGCWDGSQAFPVAGPVASFQDSCHQGLEAKIFNNCSFLKTSRNLPVNGH